MIKLTSFYPFSNLMLVTQEFHEDKILVKTRSLTYEHHSEFKYTEINEISYEYHASGNMQFWGLGLLAIVLLIPAVSSMGLFAGIELFQVSRTLYIFGTSMILAGYIKSKYYYFLDKDEETITIIKKSNWNTKEIAKAIEMVKNNSGDTQEVKLHNPFPETKPIFELKEYSILDYLGKSIERFYEDELIGHYKNMITERSYRVKYNQLSNKIYRSKAGNDHWNNVFWSILSVDLILSGFYLVFGFLPKSTYHYLSTFSLIFLAASFLLRYVKREIIGLIDKRDRIVFWTWVTESNKEKVNEIIEFTQSKITADNKF